MKVRTTLITIGLIISLNGGTFAQAAVRSPVPRPAVRAEKYYRTELYMGMSIPGGDMVSDADWEKFLSDFVTPLFPDGFSVLSGRGQYREASGVIAKEPSHVLVFLYPRSARRSAGLKIENVRSEYKKRFRQESVLRVDVTKSVLVSF